MKRVLLLFVIVPAFLHAQTDTVLSGVYHWITPETEMIPHIKGAVLFEGRAYDMEWMQVNSVEITAAREAIPIRTPGDEEQVVIVKQGKLDIELNGTRSQLDKGSVIVLMPGENFLLSSIPESSLFYVLRYRSKLPPENERGRKEGGSFVRDWNSIPFKPHDKGGVRSFFEKPTVMCRRLEMHVTTLNAGIRSHEPHTHRAEEIVLMMEGETEMQIGQAFKQGSGGDLYYLGSNVLHAIQNTGKQPCTYFAIQFD